MRDESLTAAKCVKNICKIIDQSPPGGNQSN